MCRIATSCRDLDHLPRRVEIDCLQGPPRGAWLGLRNTRMDMRTSNMDSRGRRARSISHGFEPAFLEICISKQQKLTEAGDDHVSSIRGMTYQLLPCRGSFDRERFRFPPLEKAAILTAFGAIDWARWHRGPPPARRGESCGSSPGIFTAPSMFPR